jgi:hypothetical protein
MRGDAIAKIIFVAVFPAAFSLVACDETKPEKC